MSGRRKIELARSRAIEEPGLERTVIDDGEHASRYALRIEGARALPALAQRIVDDADAGLEQAFPEPVAQKARLAGDRAAIDRAGEMADEPARDPPVEDHRHPLGRHLARIEPRNRALARGAPDPFRRIEIGSVKRRRKIVVALHGGALARDRAHRHAVTRGEVGAAKAVTC